MCCIFVTFFVDLFLEFIYFCILYLLLLRVLHLYIFSPVHLHIFSFFHFYISSNFSINPCCPEVILYSAFSQCCSVSLRGFLPGAQRALLTRHARFSCCTALTLSAQVITSLKRKESFIAEIHLSFFFFKKKKVFSFSTQRFIYLFFFRSFFCKFVFYFLLYICFVHVFCALFLHIFLFF